MTRTRASAKRAGSAFAHSIAKILKQQVHEDIDVAPPWGSADKGDIVNFRIGGHRVALECKDVKQEFCTKCGRVSGLKLPEWTGEAQVEAENYGAVAGFVVHKRKGVTDPLRQWVTATVAELIALSKGYPQ